MPLVSPRKALVHLVTVLVMVLGAGLAQQSHVSAQSGAPGSQDRSANSTEILRVTTRMVLVDAVVTDSLGNPVSGLKAADFEVRENGKVEQIRAFAERSPEILQRESAPSASPYKMPPGLFTNITDFHPEYGPLTILLIDSLNTPYFDQPYMREALIKYLQGIGSRHNLMIFTLGRRLGLIQNLNSDPQLLQEALKRIASDSSLKKASRPKESSKAADSDDRAFSLAQELLGTGPMFDKERQIGRLESSLLDQFPDRAILKQDEEVRATLASLRIISRSVAGYPGRKNLIWLSAAFPVFTYQENLGDSRNYFPEVQQTANLLADSEMAIYPVDVRGLVPNFLPDASSDIQRHGMIGGSRVTSVIAASSNALGASHSAMDYLATQTGGRAYYNRNDIEHGIALSVQDGSSYYSLGYYPTDKNWDGGFRKIQIKIHNKELHVHYRRGYYATDRTHLTPQRMTAAKQEFFNSMALDAPPATGLPIVVQVFPRAKDNGPILINIGVDPHAVSFELEGEQREAGEVEFATIVLDEKGKPVASKSNILKTYLTPETFKKVMSGSLVVQQKFDLSPGRYLLRVGVQDLRSEQVGTTTARVEVQPVKVE